MDGSVQPVTDDKKKPKPKGWLKKVFGRHAPLWVKLLRTPILALAGLLTVDAAVLPNMPGRPLTSAETTLLQEVYKDSVDYSKVRIHQSSFADAYLSLMGASAAAKGNVIFMVRAPGTEDMGRTNDTYLQYTLVHEGGHVWQKQNGVMPNAFSMAVLNIGKLWPGHDDHAHYRYTVLSGKDLLEYNLEQQASIITEFHFASKGVQPPIFSADINEKPEDVAAGYAATLRNFNANPSYPRNR